MKDVPASVWFLIDGENLIASQPMTTEAGAETALKNAHLFAYRNAKKPLRLERFDRVIP